MMKIASMILIGLLIAAMVPTVVLAAVAGTTGGAVAVPAPASVGQGDVENDTDILAFSEAQGVTLPAGVTVDIRVPGSYLGGALPAPVVAPAGLVVNSHLLHFDPIGQPPAGSATVTSGSVTFDSSVVAIIATKRTLDATDRLLGAPGTAYPLPKLAARGIEGRGRVSLSGDRLTVTVRRFAVTCCVDQVRVLTRAHFPLKLTGGGQVDTGDKNHSHSFGFNVQPEGSTVDVNLEYNDNHFGRASSERGHPSPLQIHINGLAIGAVVILDGSGNPIGLRFRAECTVRNLEADNTSTDNVCVVQSVDNGEPGVGTDTFQPDVVAGPAAGYTSNIVGSDLLTRGNVQAHKA